MPRFLNHPITLYQLEGDEKKGENRLTDVKTQKSPSYGD
jgi:hypothetical protein